MCFFSDIFVVLLFQMRWLKHVKMCNLLWMEYGLDVSDANISMLTPVVQWQREICLTSKLDVIESVQTKLKILLILYVWPILTFRIMFVSIFFFSIFRCLSQWYAQNYCLKRIMIFENAVDNCVLWWFVFRVTEYPIQLSTTYIFAYIHVSSLLLNMSDLILPVQWDGSAPNLSLMLFYALSL